MFNIFSRLLLSLSAKVRLLMQLAAYLRLPSRELGFQQAQVAAIARNRQLASRNRAVTDAALYATSQEAAQNWSAPCFGDRTTRVCSVTVSP